MNKDNAVIPEDISEYAEPMIYVPCGCPNCGQEVPYANYCCNCGQKFKYTKPKTNEIDEEF